jgi:cytochrome c-type biogenesis protein CcmE
MNMKIIIAGLIIVAALVFGAISFVDTNVEYADIRSAMATHKKVQVKGEWLREKESAFDEKKAQFVFYLKDDNGDEVRVVYDGARPNNFELAEAIVIKGRYQDGYFHANDILTKCPSKYEGDAEAMKKTL